MDITRQQSAPARIRLFYVLLIIVSAVFAARLFYLQVIRHGYYQLQAQDNQLKRYEIIAERGAIFAYDGEEQVPIVLNESQYNIVADPQIISDKESTANKVAEVLSLPVENVMNSLMRDDNSRYEILAKNQTKETKEIIEKLYLEGEIVGVFTEKVSRRVYPHGNLAAQVLGFVNDDGNGNYGVEEYENEILGGKNGRVKALTDQNGVPLLANNENTLEEAVDGRNITLTLDIAMQKQLENILKQGLENAVSESGSALIINPNTGEIKAMANYPSFDPADFRNVEDPIVFTNANVSSPLEPGSIMKTLTVASALEQGVVSGNTSYYDPGFVKVDDATVKNVEEVGGSGTRSISDILRLSLNTGAAYLLAQMGGGEINQQARENWHHYMTEKYQFGKKTGIEQGFEEPGYIPDPDDGFGLNIQYANTSFGQGMTATPLQMAAAMASVVNGGTYYRPTVISGHVNDEGEFVKNSPIIVKENVVSADTSDTLIQFMNNVINNNNTSAVREGYQVGGKTGTAEIAKPGGGYYEDKFNGTYLGYVGGDSPEYVIMVRVNEPNIAGYAGSRAAGPIFSSISNMLIDNFSVKAISR